MNNNFSKNTFMMGNSTTKIVEPENKKVELNNPDGGVFSADEIRNNMQQMNAHAPRIEKPQTPVNNMQPNTGVVNQPTPQVQQPQPHVDPQMDMRMRMANMRNIGLK